MSALGVVLAVNVSVPLPCAEQYTPLLFHVFMLAGTGVTITLFEDVTPVTDFVQVVVAFQFATVMLTVVDVIALCTAMFPEPRSEVLFIVLMFVPLTKASCLPKSFDVDRYL